MSGWKSTLRAKIKAAKRKDFRSGKNISRIYSEPLPEIADKPIQKIINDQPDIKLRHVIQEELDAVLKKKIKSYRPRRKAPEVYMIRKFDDVRLRFYNVVNEQNTFEK